MVHKIALTVAVMFAAGGIALAEGRRDARPSLPQDVVGFSGQVRGIVISKGDGVFMFKVGRVLKTWKGSKARKPGALVGMTIKVGPRSEQLKKRKRKKGKWQLVEQHVQFIAKVKVGTETTLEIRYVGRDVFQILELTAEQRAFAAGGGEKREDERREGEGEHREGDGGGHDNDDDDGVAF